VILLNNDAVAAPGFARELVAAAEASASVGMVAAKVLDHARREVIDTTGHLLHRDGLNRGRGRLETDRGQYDGLGTALFPSGAAGLYRRAMLDAIGLFEETFFLYGDDAELGLRARLCGWECAFAPRAVAFHHYSRSVGAHSALKAFYVERNRVWLALELFPAGLLLANPWHSAVRLAHHAAAALSGRGAAGRLADERSVLALVAVTLRAWASALAGVGRAWRARRRVRRLAGFDPARLRGLLREFPLSAREAAFKE
jgi:GT2 family glycosyltransferase